MVLSMVVVFFILLPEAVEVEARLGRLTLSLVNHCVH